MRTAPLVLLIAATLCNCSQEARYVGPSLPQTPPSGDDDARIPAYQANFYQVAQGGRYFAWYGCSACHTDDAPGVRNLPDSLWRHGHGFSQVYASIADRHGRLNFRQRVPVEQLWQMTAYVRDLPEHTPDKRRRLEADQKSEPVGPAWTGPK